MSNLFGYQLADLYKKYKPKGLEIFAVSLDEEKEKWMEAVKHYNTEWVDVSELVPVKNSQYAPVFNVYTTPKILIVDHESRIIAKDVYGEELKGTLEKLFNN